MNVFIGNLLEQNQTSNGTDRTIYLPRPLQPRKQSQRKCSIKARGYFETAIG